MNTAKKVVIRAILIIQTNNATGNYIYVNENESNLLPKDWI